MRENTTEVVTGGVVLVLAVAFLFYMLQVAGVSGRTGGGYPLVATFSSAEGVSVGSDVRLAGVKVGTVTGLELNPETYLADMEIQVVNGIEVPDDSSLAVSSEGLLGGNFMEIIPGGSFEFFEPGGQFLDTQSSVSLITLLLRYVGGSGEE
ncbi:outer membrane lipid asymmetry maintenance protein MlaD [Pelagovum pacificum]|uniref:Outer membrane lipid asymmetry maintenance protein MlaD n=1 Tax=Pelagovum pacificum TaxID=2588711 RepID=A0A5C5GDD6_9RHOB|nr:outer membrane lipid asymmetry maintenance protein MlaD [Pelagovum pacificum]QQA44046.1 outer membrane lipid asymmetry maintenance protein MlaD [Pelagovum pacificum]TNY32825.1 outer membrane lipid asymmetry maintenance protein MlaD [Pelagovum pacificum]